MNCKNCEKQTNSISNRKMEEDTALGKKEDQERLFPLLWILGFSILSEIFLFVIQELGRSLIEWIQAFSPEDCPVADLLFDDGAVRPIPAPHFCHRDSPLCIRAKRAVSAACSDCGRGALSLRAYGCRGFVGGVGLVFVAVRRVDL